MTNIIVFDALDTLQGYRGAPKGTSKQFYQEYLARQAGMGREAFLQATPYATQLEQTVRAIESGNLEPIMLEGAEQTLRYVNEQGLTPVIVTADIPEGARLTAKPMVDAGLIAPERVYAIDHVGKKSEIVTWRKAGELYFPDDTVIGVFEDSEDYLFKSRMAYAQSHPSLEKMIFGNETGTRIAAPGFLVEEESLGGKSWAEHRGTTIKGLEWRGNHEYLRKRLEEVLRA